MFTLFRQLLFGLSRPKTRITEEQAKALAGKAAEAAHIEMTPGFVTVRHIEGRLTWIVSTPTIGSGWHVRIDDATGEVGPVKRWGIR
jgi:hypothetical protein